MFIAIESNSGLAFVAKADSTLDAFLQYHHDVGIDPEGQGLPAIADGLVFYRIYDQDAYALDVGSAEWPDVFPSMRLDAPVFPTLAI
jgi:hypothetical protein